MKLAFFACLACAYAQDGADLFASRCAGCHGADGAGGEHAPSILENTRRDVRETIVNGLKDRGMPAFTLSEVELSTLLAHVSSLRASFAGHAPKTVTLRLKNGQTLTGIVRNESNYDLQLQGSDGALRAISRSQILTEANAAKVAISPASAATLSPKPGDWPTYHGNFNGNRHSDLNQIDVSNVSRLAPAWMFPIANAKRLEGTPIVVGGVMYVTTANECYALDAKNGRQIWHYSRPLTKGVIGDAASAINRGVAVLNEKIFMFTDMPISSH